MVIQLWIEKVNANPAIKESESQQYCPMRALPQASQGKPNSCCSFLKTRMTESSSRMSDMAGMCTTQILAKIVTDRHFFARVPDTQSPNTDRLTINETDTEKHYPIGQNTPKDSSTQTTKQTQRLYNRTLLQTSPVHF
jgi:hypothetical protein